ncbi:MAG: HD domain-containing protein [Lachnospiraceae bacterium]
MLKEAVAFAAKAHEGAVRKGTTIPYITHPMETAVIVSLMTSDEEVIAAAVLHDVLEDTAVTIEQLREKFGTRVAELVLSETEDKRKSWKERKAWGIRRAREASREGKIMMLGDKLSNLRSTARDYLLLGEQIWERFNEKDKAMHAWYYCGIADALKDLEPYPAYQEFVMLCKKVFGYQAG